MFALNNVIRPSFMWV